MGENDKSAAIGALMESSDSSELQQVDENGQSVSLSGSAYTGEQFLEYTLEPSPKDLLPTAAELAEFERVQPGMSGEMLKRVDGIITHRQEVEIRELALDEKKLEHVSNARRLGQYLGFGVTIFAIAVIFVCALLDKNSTATMIPPAIIAVTGLAAVLLKK